MTNRLIDELHRQQTSLSEVFAVLSRDPDSVNFDLILSQLDAADRDIERITAEGAQVAKNFILEQPFKTRLVVFSAARNDTRAVWQDNVEKYLCDTRKEIQVEPTQPPASALVTIRSGR